MFEGGTPDILEAKQGNGSWERACQNNEAGEPDLLLFEEKAEIKA